MVYCEGTLSFLEYAFATTTTQLKSRSVGENMILIPHSSKEAMELPEAEKWKAAVDKENGKPQGLRGLHPGTCFEHSSGKKAYRNQVGGRTPPSKHARWCKAGDWCLA